MSATLKQLVVDGHLWRALVDDALGAEFAHFDGGVDIYGTRHERSDLAKRVRAAKPVYRRGRKTENRYITDVTYQDVADLIVVAYLAGDELGDLDPYAARRVREWNKYLAYQQQVLADLDAGIPAGQPVAAPDFTKAVQQ